jgi:hypothetical protein
MKIVKVRHWIIGVILVSLCLSGCGSPNDSEKAEAVYWCIHDAADFADRSVQSALDDMEREEAEKERLVDTDENLGYPEGYDPNNPIANGEFTEEDWAAIQQEEAMNSLAQDAMRDFYEEKPDISDRVIKP